MKDNSLNIKKYFSLLTIDDWRDAAKKTLKGKPLEKLTYKAYEGFSVEPLYWEDQGNRERGYPDFPPYGRGSNVLERRLVGWDIRECYDGGSLEEINSKMKDALNRGVRSFWFIPSYSRHNEATNEQKSINKFNREGLKIDSSRDLEKLLEGFDLRETLIAIDAGVYGLPTLGMLLLAAEKQGIDTRELRGSVYFDPLGVMARDGVLSISLDDAWQDMADMTLWSEEKAPQVHTIAFSGLPYHDGGANVVQEVAYILSSAVETFRQLEKRGLSLENLASHCVVQMGVGRDLFMEIAKIRAFRTLWSFILNASGVSDSGQKVFIHACTSRVTQAKRDPWVNMLRGTSETFSAVIGGADAITVLPFDHLLVSPEKQAYRIASNSQVVLLQESYLNQVVDPAGGSWYIESLTDSIMKGAWELFQSIEADGGMVEVLTSGRIAKEIRETVKARKIAIAKRKEPIVGVSEFANLQEDSLLQSSDTYSLEESLNNTTKDLEKLKMAFENSELERQEVMLQLMREHHDISSVFEGLHPNRVLVKAPLIEVFRQSADWELLRDNAESYESKNKKSLKVFLGNLGSIPEHKARAEFAKPFFAAGGFEPIENNGFSSVKELGKAFAKSDAHGVVICGKDEVYEEMLIAVAEELKQYKPDFIALAGRPQKNEARWREVGLTHFIYLGCDALHILEDIQKACGGLS